MKDELRSIQDMVSPYKFETQDIGKAKYFVNIYDDATYNLLWLLHNEKNNNKNKFEQVKCEWEQGSSHLYQINYSIKKPIWLRFQFTNIDGVLVALYSISGTYGTYGKVDKWIRKFFDESQELNYKDNHFDLKDFSDCVREIKRVNNIDKIRV